MSGPCKDAFKEMKSCLITSESVTEGHPDKLCDQISDAILDAMLEKDPYARVACETAVTLGMVIVLGEISCNCYVDIPDVVKQVIKDAGYTNPEYGYDYRTVGVIVSLKKQSSDIDMGVSQSLEKKGGQQEDELSKTGAGDQGMMVGYAHNVTPEFMPLSISLAHKLCRRLALVRKEGIVPYLRPDGKSQVTIEYCYGKPKRVARVVIAAQHDPGINHAAIENDLIKQVIREAIPADLLDSSSEFFINSTGQFVIGGPVSDTGFTGRKIIVDSYGSAAHHGGGAFSGKDPTKVDRSAAYMSRYIAKNIVAAGIADRIEIRVAYTIGKAHPLSLSVETFHTGKIADEAILGLINEHFDLRPEAIIRTLNLRRPIYRQTAAYGHFGREDLDLPWEKTDRVAALRASAGL